MLEEPPVFNPYEQLEPEQVMQKIADLRSEEKQIAAELALLLEAARQMVKVGESFEVETADGQLVTARMTRGQTNKRVNVDKLAEYVDEELYERITYRKIRTKEFNEAVNEAIIPRQALIDCVTITKGQPSVTISKR